MKLNSEIDLDKPLVRFKKQKKCPLCGGIMSYIPVSKLYVKDKAGFRIINKSNISGGGIFACHVCVNAERAYNVDSIEKENVFKGQVSIKNLTVELY